MPLYRSLGWELAGGRHTAVIPARSLFSLAPPDVAGLATGGTADGDAALDAAFAATPYMLDVF